MNGGQLVEQAWAIFSGSVFSGLVSFVLAFWYWRGKLDQRLTNIEGKLADILTGEARCKTAREKEEKTLHGRITEVVADVGYIRGRMNGKGGSG